MTYHSEHGQDRWLEENIFKGQRGGTFVELGALDGIYTSNTLFFEQERGWNGILIEANPAMFAALLLKSERRATKVCAAVGDSYEMATFLAVRSVAGWSGLLHSMDGQHKERIAHFVKSDDLMTYEMPTVPLDAILRRSLTSPVIDYLSLDVEGAEFNILRTLDLREFQIRVLDVENNYGDPSVEQLLWSQGYVKIHSLEINDIYMRREEAGLFQVGYGGPRTMIAA